MKMWAFFIKDNINNKDEHINHHTNAYWISERKELLFFLSIRVKLQVPQNSYIEALHPNVTTLGRQGFGKGNWD
jgi:hypothetical protein